LNESEQTSKRIAGNGRSFGFDQVVVGHAKETLTVLADGETDGVGGPPSPEGQEGRVHLGFEGQAGHVVGLQVVSEVLHGLADGDLHEGRVQLAEQGCEADACRFGEVAVAEHFLVTLALTLLRTIHQKRGTRLSVGV